MGTGTGRREVVADSLAGEALITPARLSGPGIQSPRVPAPQQETMTSKITKEIGNWATEQLVEEARKDQERSLMDGAIDAVQGKTFDQLVMDGANKFAQQGHRLITAQTMSAGLASAQKALIANSAFSMTSEEYKAQLGNQLEALVQGQNPRVARMIRERLTDALPELVAMHTVANANFNEQETFTSLVQGISAQSTDTMSIEAMLSFVAGGPDSASGALSDARRQQATVEGIVLGFVERNPLPFALIKAAGLLDGMTTDQLNRINDAETQYFNLNEREYNSERRDRVIALDIRKDAGKISPDQYSAEMIIITEEHGGRVDAASVKEDYLSAKEPWRQGQHTRYLLAEAARTMNDPAAFAAATEGLVIHVESHGDPNALSSKGAEGLLQVMPPTQRKPGFGLEPSDGTPEDTFRLGQEYWALVIRGSSDKFGKFNWDPMDIEAAAIAYNAGWTRANAWIAAGRDYSVLPPGVIRETKPYAQQIAQDYKDQNVPSQGDLLSRAKAIKKGADVAVSAETWGIAARLLADENELHVSGKIDKETWLSRRAGILQTYKIDVSKSIVSSELAITKSMRLAAAKDLAEREDNEAMAQIDEQLLLAKLEYQLILADETVDFPGMLDAYNKYVSARTAAFSGVDISIVDPRNQKAIVAAWTSMITAIPVHQKWGEDTAEIARAVKDGTVTLLPPKLRKRQHDEMITEASRLMQEAKARSDGGEDSEDAAAEFMDDAEFANSKNNGQVYPESRLKEGKMIAPSSLLNADGDVSEIAVGSIMRYIKFSKQVTPALAAQFYPPDKLGFANAVVDVAGIDGNIPEAIKRVHNERLENALKSQGLSNFMKLEATTAQLAKTMKKYREREDTSYAQALASSEVDLGDPHRVLVSEQRGREEAEDRITAALANELRIQKVLNPNMDTDSLLLTAQQRLEERSDFIGGSWVYADFNIKNAMFGDKATNFDKIGIVNEAIILYFADLGKTQNVGYVDNVGLLEFLPRFLQPRSLLGFELGVDRGMSFLDAPEALLRGLRPFTSGIDGSGQLYIRMFDDRGGQATPISMSPEQLLRIGDYYMHRNPNFRKDNKGDTVPAPRSEAVGETIFGNTLFGRQAGDRS